jgi:hypothetical protein
MQSSALHLALQRRSIQISTVTWIGSNLRRMPKFLYIHRIATLARVVMRQ